MQRCYPNEGSALAEAAYLGRLLMRSLPPSLQPPHGHVYYSGHCCAGGRDKSIVTKQDRVYAIIGPKDTSRSGLIACVAGPRGGTLRVMKRRVPPSQRIQDVIDAIIAKKKRERFSGNALCGRSFQDALIDIFDPDNSPIS